MLVESYEAWVLLDESVSIPYQYNPWMLSDMNFNVIRSMQISFTTNSFVQSWSSNLLRKHNDYTQEVEFPKMPFTFLVFNESAISQYMI